MMSSIKAFVGHSFNEKDDLIVRKFIEHFNAVKDMGYGFTWDHAEKAEPKDLCKKVMEKMEDKNLFIGILTANENAIESEKLSNVFLSGSKLKGKKEDFYFKTSDWIIQEMGYALGKGMDLILLIESGVKFVGGLQGDIERILFDREKPENAFNKFLQMISILTPKIEAIENTAISRTQPEEESHEEPEIENASNEPNNNWSMEVYEFEITRNFRRNENEIAESIYNEFLETEEGKVHETRIIWQAKFLYLKQIYKRENHLEALKDLAKTHSTIGEIRFLVGKIYEYFKEYENALIYYDQASNNTNDPNKKLKYIFERAKTFIKNNNFEEANGLFRETQILKSKHQIDNLKYLELARLFSELKGDDNCFIAFSEAILSENPGDFWVRNSLAFKYQQLNKNKLAFFHYKFLSQLKPEEGYIWNNLGVAYFHLNLEAKSIESYKKARDLKYTLAMSNLAHRYLNAGFHNEAKDVFDEGQRIENCHENLSRIPADLEKAKEAEDKKKENLLEEGRKLKEFFQKFGLACTEFFTDNIDGIWESPTLHLKLTVENNILSGKGYFKETGLAQLLTGGSSAETNEATRKTLIISGKMTGLGIHFEINEKENQSTLLISKPSVKGLMLIDNNLKEIQVYEEKDQDKESFYTLMRIE